MPLPRIIRRLLWLWAFFLAFLCVLVLLGIFLPSVVRAPESERAGSGDTLPMVRLVDDAGTTMMLPVELATTPAQHSLGLMNRPVVKTGMLFVFEDEIPRSFWMKNTLVPLDIAFFTSKGVWVSSARMEPCTVDPCASYPSAGPAMYALELPAGGIGRGIGTGWKLLVQ